MVKIEYSPNSRASCQACRQKILSSEIRVAVSASSPYVRRGRGYQTGTYIVQYYHSQCYHNRTDFTKFYGFWSLTVADQKRLMTAEQRKQHFAEELVEEALSAMSGSGTATAVSELTLTITGLKYACVRAVPEQKVLLVREPENKYDCNAVKVTSLGGDRIGHIKKEQAAKLSPQLAQMAAAGKNVVVECTVLDNGDGWKQSVRVVLRKEVTAAACGNAGTTTSHQPSTVQTTVAASTSTSTSTETVVDDSPTTTAPLGAKSTSTKKQMKRTSFFKKKRKAPTVAENDGVATKKRKISNASNNV